MQIHSIDIAVVVIYLLAVLGLGLYQALKIRTSGDYYAGGRKFNKFYLMMHALGTASHVMKPVSVIGGAYQKGIAGIWYTYIYLPLTPIFWFDPAVRPAHAVYYHRGFFSGSLRWIFGDHVRGDGGAENVGFDWAGSQ